MTTFARPKLARGEPVDPIAVERIAGGDPPTWFTVAERAEAVVVLTHLGLSAAEIARRIRASDRTVQRYRVRTGVDQQRTPASPHGTIAAYRRHQRAGEQPCCPCVDASRSYWAAQWRRLRLVQGGAA